MKTTQHSPKLINSISEAHRLMGLDKPSHPLVSLIHFEDVSHKVYEGTGSFIQNFYAIAMKKGFKGKIKYGRNYYDFDDGILSFLAPGQVIGEIAPDDRPTSGWTLFFHPDFIRNHPLGARIKDYGFFSYELYEALHVSDKEEKLMNTVADHIEQEYQSATDLYSQNEMISHIEVMLNYADRFYNRQFITRKQAGNDLLIKLDDLLKTAFAKKSENVALPTVHYVAEQLNVSASYLSDMLRATTGQNTQQHIHNYLIEAAKEILTTTSLSVSEIAYQLGFEYPQYFSRLFKNKTNTTPLKYRKLFN